MSFLSWVKAMMNCRLLYLAKCQSGGWERSKLSGNQNNNSVSSLIMFGSMNGKLMTKTFQTVIKAYLKVGRLQQLMQIVNTHTHTHNILLHLWQILWQWELMCMFFPGLCVEAILWYNSEIIKGKTKIKHLLQLSPSSSFLTK